jgi:hypothetical protein
VEVAGREVMLALLVALVAVVEQLQPLAEQTPGLEL